jgi:iron complex outermembrane receptor protein
MKKAAVLCFFFGMFVYADAQEIRLTDAKTGEPVSGKIKFLSTGKEVSTNGRGVCKAPTPCSDSLRVEVFTEGYVLFSGNIPCFGGGITQVPLQAIEGKGTEILIEGTRAGAGYPVVYSTLNSKELAKANNGQDIPMVLNRLPSVVSNSDAGAGIGYTGLRIRGSDGTRINTTVNGIPINDAESQMVYFVNMPDLIGSAEDIQVQRGVGTSTNGTAAFGGAINIFTARVRPEPYVQASLGAGSFGMQRGSIRLGTGQLKSGFSADFRGSAITSAGFIDRASAALYAYYGGLNYVKGKNSLKFVTFEGSEKTYQAWNGIPQARLSGDSAQMQAYIQRNFLDREDSLHLLQSGSRTYNSFTYKNQTDNYRQRHYQLHASRDFSGEWAVNASLHYTKGAGYYEEWRKGDAVSDYGISPMIAGIDTFKYSNLVRRKWLDNDFYGAMVFAKFHRPSVLRLIAGVGANRYEGHHFGKIVWAQYMPGVLPDADYYRTHSTKSEANGFIKSSYYTGPFQWFADLQLRTIDYSFFGFDEQGLPSQQQVKYQFFNPKAGVSLPIDNRGEAYISWSRGHREPTREDFVSSSARSRPLPERMDDFEGGLRMKWASWQCNVNAFYINYYNQLVLTGRINDVGSYTRENVKNSYRTGIEIEGMYQIFPGCTVSGNVCYSKNVIRNYTEFVDNYDIFAQQANALGNRQISFSPDWVSFSQLEYTPIKHLSMAVSCKQVSSMFLDNSGSTERKIEGYEVFDGRMSYHLQVGGVKMDVNLWVHNLLDKKYITNGYTWGYIAGGTRVSENFYFPAAGRYFTTGITFGF